MSVTNCQVRRATVDDLTLLRRLWQQAGQPVAELEKRFQEFQVVETAEGELLGAVGLHIEQQQGQIHNEGYLDPASATGLRPRLWERLQGLARSHGLHRLWIEHGSSVFWLEAGFEPASRQLTEKAPATFQLQAGGAWLTLKLREVTEASVFLEQELAIFRQAQAQQGQRVTRQAQTLKVLAALTVMAVLVVVAAAILYTVRHWHRLPHRP